MNEPYQFRTEKKAEDILVLGGYKQNNKYWHSTGWVKEAGVGAPWAKRRRFHAYVRGPYLIELHLDVLRGKKHEMKGKNNYQVKYEVERLKRL